MTFGEITYPKKRDRTGLEQAKNRTGGDSQKKAAAGEVTDAHQTDNPSGIRRIRRRDVWRRPDVVGGGSRLIA
ncbi:hypothetical protein NL676_011924 [Syzygium grande]|nr:hypothetical protein NL676_011924 [Syzygium grande]